MYGPSKGVFKTSNKSDLVDAIAVRNDVQVLVLESASESTVDSRLEHPVQTEAIQPTTEQNVSSPEYQITVVPNSGNNAFLVRRLPESGRDILPAPALQESPRSAGNIFLGGTERASVNRRARSDNDIKKRSKSDEYFLADESHNMQDSRRMLMFLKQVADGRDMMNVETKSNSGSHRSTASGRTRRSIIPVIPIKKQRRNVEITSSHNQQHLKQCLQKNNFVATERTKIFPRMARLASLKCIRYDKRPMRSMKARFQHLRPLSFNRQCSGYDDDYNDPDPDPEQNRSERKANTVDENYDENHEQPTVQPAETRDFHCVCEEGVICRVSKQQYSVEQLEEEECEEYEEFEEMEEMEENVEPEPSHHSSTRSPTRSVQDTVQYQYCNEDDCQNVNRNVNRSPIRSSHTCDCIESTPSPMQPYDYCTVQTCINQQEQNQTVSCPTPIERSRQNCECGVVVTNIVPQALKATDYCAIPSNHSRSPTQSIQNQQVMRQSPAVRSRQNCECNENVYYTNETYQDTNQSDFYAVAIPQNDYCTNETCFIEQNQIVCETQQDNASNWDCNFQTCNNRNPKTDWNVNQNVPIKQVTLQKSGQSYFNQPSTNRSCTSQSCNRRIDQFSQQAISNKRSRQGSQNFNNRSFDKKTNNSRNQKCCDCNDCDGMGYGQQKERPSVSDQNRYSPNHSNHSSRRQSQNLEPTVQVRKQTSQKCDCNYYKDSDQEEVADEDSPYGEGIIKTKHHSDSFQVNNSSKNFQLQQKSYPINSHDPCNNRSCTSRHSRQNSLNSKSNAASKSKRSFCNASCNSSHLKHYNNRSGVMNQSKLNNNMEQNQSYAQSQKIAVSRVVMNQSRNAYEQLTKYEPCTSNICPQKNNLLPVKSPKTSIPYHINASQQNQYEPCTNNICSRQFSIKSPKTSVPYHSNAPQPCTNYDCSQQRPQPCINTDCSQQRQLPCTIVDCSQQYPHPSANQNYVSQQNQYVACTNNNVYPQNLPLQNEYGQYNCNSCGQKESESCSSSICQQQQDYYLDGPCDEDVCPLPVTQNSVFADPGQTLAVSEISRTLKYPCNECETDNGRNAGCPGRRKGAINHAITCRICKMRDRLLGRSKKANKCANEGECNEYKKEPGAPIQCCETVQQEYVYNESCRDISLVTDNVCDPKCSQEARKYDSEEIDYSDREGSNVRYDIVPDYPQDVCDPSSKPPKFGCVPECAQSVCDPTCMPPEYECEPECKAHECDPMCLPPEYACVPDCASAPLEDFSITDFPQSEELIKKVYDYCECTSSHTYSSHIQKTASSRKPIGDKIGDPKRLEPPKRKSSCVCSVSSNGRSSFKSDASSKNYDLKKKNITESCDCSDSSSKTLAHTRLRGSDFCDGGKKRRKVDSTRKDHSAQKREKDRPGTCICSESVPAEKPTKLTYDKETQSEKRRKCKEVKHTEPNEVIPDCPPPKLDKETQLKKSRRCKKVKDDMDSNEDIPPKIIPECPPNLGESSSSDHKLKARQYCNGISKIKPKKEECEDEDSSSDMPDCKDAQPKSKKTRKCKKVKDKDSNEDIPECPPPKPDKGTQHKKRRKCEEVKDMDSNEDIRLKKIPECSDEESSDHKFKASQYCMDNDSNSDMCEESKSEKIVEKPSKAKPKKKAKQEEEIDEQSCDEDQPTKRKPKKICPHKCKKHEQEEINKEVESVKEKPKNKCSSNEEEEIMKSENPSKCACKLRDSDKEENLEDLECNNESEDSDHKLRASFFCEKEKPKKKCHEINQDVPQTLKKPIIRDDSCVCRSKTIINKETEPYVSDSCICESYIKPKKVVYESQDSYTKKPICCFEKTNEVIKGKLKASDYCEKRLEINVDTKPSCDCVPPKQPSKKSIRKCSCNDKEDVCVCKNKEDVCVCKNKENVCVRLDKEDVCVCNKKSHSKPKSNSRENCSRECKRFSDKRNRNEFHDCADTTDMSNASLCKCKRMPTRSEICDENCVALKHNRSGNISKSCKSSDRSKPRKDLCGCNKEEKAKESKKAYSACYENDDDSSGAEQSFKERPRSKSGTCCKDFWDSQENGANIHDTRKSDGRGISDRLEHKLAKSVSQYESQRYSNNEQRSKRRDLIEKRSSHDNQSKQGSHYNRRSRNEDICVPDRNERSSESSRNRSRCTSDKDSREYGSNQRSQSIHRSNKDTYSNCSSETQLSRREQNDHNSGIDRNCREQERSCNSYNSKCSDRRSVVKGTSHSPRNSDCNDDNRSMRETSSCNKPSTSTAKNYKRFKTRTNSSDDEESVEEKNYHFQNQIGSSCCSHNSDNFIVYNCNSDTNSCDYLYESDNEEVVIYDYKEEKTYITIKETRTSIKIGNNKKILSNVSICKEMELAKSEVFDIDKIERSTAPPKNPNNIFLEDYKDPKKSKRKSPVTSNVSDHPTTFSSTVKDSVRSMGGFCNKRNRNRRINRRNTETNPPPSHNTEEILENVTNTDANEQVIIIYVNQSWQLDSSAPNTAGNSIHTIRSQRNTGPRNSPN